MKGTLIDSNYDENENLQLRVNAVGGDRTALEKLINNHYSFIYNVAWKMTAEPSDAEDITQDIIIKIITNLSSFKGQSSFRTWLYRLVVNHVLNMKKRHCEFLIGTFSEYGDVLERMPNADFPKEINSDPEKEMILKEIKYSCTAGMLLCLSREQRLLYILGAIFEIDHTLGAEIMNLSKDNYRQKLSRARKELSQFMNDKCSLITKTNPCKCNKKAKAFIEQGVVDPKKLVYNTDYVNKIFALLPVKQDSMEMVLEEKIKQLYQDSPFQEKKELKERLHQVISSKNFGQSFNLN
ncbi:RNA polymerase sigma factor [Flagellimonas nanhaiensis]|uniref:RNA polymerase sigma factor n=1 Tax=Flagellimonas nanhaiensis TaxID=2292706 RepID=A0A371JT05_9FLAO|nr:RNA polymerase sigma factor [Allomuricauda nanhaiensis]RDY60889.1 RNA polymerase sigma factor [Allomuricauda nanhaiensis]